MDVRDVWARKTDDEVATAFATIDQYTVEAQVVIRAEYEHRSRRPSLPDRSSARKAEAAQDEPPPRQRSLTAARARFSSLAGQSSRTRATDVADGSTERRAQADAIPPKPATRVTRYEYKVVPFIGRNKGDIAAVDVARQLQHVIGEHATGGWEFHQMRDVNVEVQPGCLAGLFGGSVHYVRFDQLIFRRARLT